MNKSIWLLFGVFVMVLVLFIINKSTQEEINVPVSTEKELEPEHEKSALIDHHLHGAKVEVATSSMTADLDSLGLMPMKGESGAVGYGLITGKGTDAIIVSATHGGVLDSQLQKDASDPVWHNHMVKLGEVQLCGKDPGVIDITFESPGGLEVSEGGLVIVDAPADFSGVHSLSKKKLNFAPGTDIQKVVQFHLAPKFSDKDELLAVCVTDIKEVAFERI